MKKNSDMAAKEEATRAYIRKHRPELRKSVRERYGLLRIVLVVYGGFMALGYLLSPFVNTVRVPDFALNIFLAMLSMLTLAEIILRMTEYSCEIYSFSSRDTENDDCEKKKDSLFLRITFGCFPFRDIHRNLIALWFFLATYYLVVYGIGYGKWPPLYPENFSLSFFYVAGACVFDFISKGLFIFRIPGLGGVMAEFANSAIRSDGNVPTKILNGFLKIFQKISFKK